MSYSDYDKAMAIEIVRRNNGILTALCLADIRQALKSPDLKQQTIRYWMKTLDPSPLSDQKKKPSRSKIETINSIEIREHVAKALDQKLEDAAHLFVDHATKADTIEKMSGTAAMTSAAIAIEKMRLLRDLPTEIIGAIPVLTKLNELFKQLDTPLGDALEDYYQKLHRKVIEQQQK